MARADFKIAIVCALREESSAVRAVFDETWDSSQYGKAQNDPNAYTPGRIGRHNVVLAYLPGMDGPASGTLTAHFLHSYPSIGLVLVVGICGGAPFGENKRPIGLGDVVISNSIVQYTYGRRFPDRLRRKDTLADSFSRPNQAIRSFLHMLETIPERKLLRKRMVQALKRVLEDEDYVEWKRPTEETNKLFNASYRHKHQQRGECETCDRCTEDRDEVCERALTATCFELGCDGLQSETRSGTSPAVHFGKIASADQVMKSAIDRDMIVGEERAIAFEMEGAGAWENIPTIIIKSVCDFADSHKNKDWQKYASAVAACCMKALLTAWTPADAASSFAKTRPFRVPFYTEAKNSPNFVGRQTEMAELEETLVQDSNSTARRKVFVTYGMGGIGKTQLALSFAHKHMDRYDAVVWLDGSSISSVKKSFADFGSRLHDLGKIAGEHPGSDSDAIVQQVLSWLSLPDNKNWLLVFDNVDRDPFAAEKDEQAFDPEKFFPRAFQGAILITTRLDGLFRLGRDRKIEGVKHEEAKNILESSMGRSVRDGENVQETLQRFQGLPLALTLAGSYIRDVGIPLSEYNRQYEQKWLALMKSQDKYRLREYADRSMLTTWIMSFEQVKRESSSAAELLELWSFFASSGLSFKLFDLFQSDRGQKIKAADWLKDDFAFTEAVRPLIRYSLINKADDESGYSVHPVLHDWCFDRVRHQDEEQKARPKCWLASNLIADRVPFDEAKSTYWQERRHMLPHAMKVCQRVEQCCGSITNEACEQYLSNAVKFRFGKLFSTLGELRTAGKMYESALAGYEKALGGEHISTLDAVHSLGKLYYNQGRYVEAEKMYIRSLGGRMKILGHEHKSTLDAVHDLGTLYYGQGKLVQAEKIYMVALNEQEKILGGESTSTLSTINDLGNLYFGQDRFLEAEKMYNRALIGFEKALGGEHTSTLATVSGLATLYRSQGKLEEAEKMLLRVLSGYKNELGDEHASTLETMNHLGMLYSDQGKLEEAEAMYVKALPGFEKLFGREHLSTIGTVYKLGILCARKSRIEEAEMLYLRALAGYNKALGREHEWTLWVVQGLAMFYRGRGFRACEGLMKDDPAADPMQTVKRIARLCENYESSTASFSELGRSLLWVRNEHDAAVAFHQQEIETADGIVIVSGVKCDMCGCSPINATHGRYVCKTCRDVDLCQPCYHRHETGEKCVTRCIGHSFTSIKFSPQSILTLDERTAWLQKLQAGTEEPSSLEVLPAPNSSETTEQGDTYLKSIQLLL